MALHHGSMNDDGSRRFRIGRIGASKTGEVALLELLKEKPDTTDPRRRFDVRTKEDGKQWTFEIFNAISGQLIDVYKQPREINGVTETILVADMRDGIDLYRIEVGPFDSRYSMALMASLADPNFKLSDPFRMQPYAFTDKATGKPRIGVTCHSGANKLEKRRGVPDTDFCPPEPTQTVFKGETLWDWIPVAEYLYNWMRFNIFDAAAGNPLEIEPAKAVEQFLNPAPAGTDDLPF
jgi:hypothetical protein